MWNNNMFLQGFNSKILKQYPTWLYVTLSRCFSFCVNDFENDTNHSQFELWLENRDIVVRKRRRNIHFNLFIRLELTVFIHASSISTFARHCAKCENKSQDQERFINHELVSSSLIHIDVEKSDCFDYGRWIDLRRRWTQKDYESKERKCWKS